MKLRLFSFLLSVAASAGAAEKPNILYILADDLGYGDVSALNPKRGKLSTPHLDRLASQGMTFTDAHSGSAVCTPTRYSILTGRYAWRTRLARGVLEGAGPPLIEPWRLTVAELLKQEGYRTACFGKWHLGMDWSPWQNEAARKSQPGWRFDFSQPAANGPLAHGFDTFFGISASLDMPPFGFIEGDRFTAPPTALKEWVREGPTVPGFEAIDVLPALTRRTVEMIIDPKGDKPFFIYLPLASPHTPILPTAEWQGKSGLGPYGDFVMQTDACVGELLAALDKTGQTQNTLVIFTSDNGFAPAADLAALEKQGHFPSGEFRGAKADIWEGGHRVPFFVRWPGRVKAGSTSDTTICLSDLMATVADITGAVLPPNAVGDSFSILPDLLATGKSARPSTVHHSVHGQFAIRSGPWKLAFCPGSGGWAKPGDVEARKLGLPAVQLFDLSTDIGETKNLQHEQPAVVARLTAELEELVARGRSTPGPDLANDRVVDFRIAHP